MSNGDTRSVTPRPETRLAEVETASMTAAQHCDAQAFCEQIKRDQLRSLTLRHEKSRDETFAMPEPSSRA